jgi:hypothetical protein
MDNKRTVYFINELERATDGGYIPCIAVEGEKGYYKTDWNWGPDFNLANQIADEKNAALGFTPKEAILIQLSTMKDI